MLLESLDDTLAVNGKKYPKGTQFEMTNIGGALDAIEAGLMKAVEKPAKKTDAAPAARK